MIKKHQNTSLLDNKKERPQKKQKQTESPRNTQILTMNRLCQTWQFFFGICFLISKSLAFLGCL